MVAAFLLQDVIGVPTVLVGYSNQDGGFRRLAAGASDAVLEMWSSDMGALVAEYVMRRGVVEELGSLRYTGQISWFFPQAIADAHPHLILSSWRSLRDPAVLALLPLANSTLPGRDAAGNYLCQESWCTDGVFVPPWCAGPNAVVCREVYMPIPDYNKGEDEQRIVSLALPLTIVYLGTDKFSTTINACITSTTTNSTCLFYYWIPDPLLAGHAVVKVHFEEPEPRCWDRFNASLVLPANGASYLACDWPVEFLGKMARSSLRHDQPALREFLQLFTLDAADMAFMMQSHPTPSEIADMACSWVKEFEGKWSSMIPPPMSGAGVTLPYLVTPHAAGTCRASSALTEIGLAVALSGILAKAWRLYLVFFNPNVAFVMFSRLVRISVSDKALVALGSTIIAVSTILAMLAVATSTTRTELLDIDVSPASFVTICTPLALSTAAARASAVFRLVLAASTAGVAFRVRSAFTIAGDARNAWFAAAALALACILTATVHAIVLPLLLVDPLDYLVADLVARLLLSTALVSSVAIYAWSHVSLPDDNDFIQATGEGAMLDVPAIGGGPRILAPTLGQVGGGAGGPDISATTPSSPIVVVSDTAAAAPCEPVPRVVPITVVSWPDAESLHPLSFGGSDIVGMLGRHLAVRRVSRVWWRCLWSRAFAPWVNVTLLLVLQADLTNMGHLLVMVPTANNAKVPFFL
ncbi:hypothetical protein GGF31_007368 [Allomyces arbusculus]|nr:hypothetical protein GGF31_007368 [Allomyces arbusculus]